MSLDHDWMKQRRPIARRVMFGTLAAAFVGASAVALAQPLGGPGMMGGGRGGGGMMRGGAWTSETYVASLKNELAITPAQEPAWKEYAETLDGVAEQMEGLHQTMYDAMGTASWEERRDMMNTMFAARQQAFDQVHAAATKLLASLTPEQRAKAQDSLPGLASPRGMTRRHWPR